MRTLPTVAIFAAFLATVSAPGCMDDTPRGVRLDFTAALLTSSADQPIRWSVYGAPDRLPGGDNLQAINQTFERLNGPGSSTLTHLSLFSSSREEWDLVSLLQIALDLQDAEGPDEDQRAIRFVYLPGLYQPGDGTNRTGVAIHDTAFVFPDRVAQANIGELRFDDPGLNKSHYVLAIARHELGHLLGLVETGTPMLTARHPPPHVDPGQAHSDRPESVMYYANIETLDDQVGEIQRNLEPPTDYDALDWHDLRSYQRLLREDWPNA